MSATPHLSVEQLAGMIDGTLAADDRERTERHLAVCDECREELATCTRVVGAGASAGPPARRFPWRHLVPLAAGILLVVWIRRPADRERVVDTPERAAPGDGSRITTVAPAAGATVDSRSLRFVWHPTEGSVGYRVVVKDTSGAPVWSGDATDTSLALPDSVRLDRNTGYVWRVDGQRMDGSTAASAEMEFRMTR